MIEGDFLYITCKKIRVSEAGSNPVADGGESGRRELVTGGLLSSILQVPYTAGSTP
jgi:hypothetical protein